MIYHLTLDGSLEPESLASEGFVHCSTREQLLDTAGRYFAGVDHLRVLIIDPGRLGVQVRYENGFPHVYGPLAPEAVVGETVLRWRDGRHSAPIFP